MVPRCAARMMTGSASLNAARAASRSPRAMASSTLRTDVRMAERRALLIRVRRAILRVALRADLVFAIGRSFAGGRQRRYRKKPPDFQENADGNYLPSRARLIG